MGQVKTVERGLIWALVREPQQGLEALAELETGDTDGLATRSILEQARSLQEWPAASLPDTLIARLTSGEASLVAEIGRQSHPPPPPPIASGPSSVCGSTASGPQCSGKSIGCRSRARQHYEAEIDSLWSRKRSLLQQIEALMDAG